MSASTGSRTLSPKTPPGRQGAGPNSNDYFSPAIADTTSPGQGGQPGAYGGFGDPQPYEPEPMYGYGSSPKKQAPAPSGLLERMNTIAPGPFEMNRRAGAKNAFAPSNDYPDLMADDMAKSDYGIERPSTAASYSSNNSNGMPPPRVPRKNGYGGFGPPQREQEDDFEPRLLGAGQRSETFPKSSQNRLEDIPMRTPSEPGLRQSRLRRQTNEDAELGRPVMTRDRMKRPSVGMRDTPRPPPPRTSLVRPPTAGQDLSINLVDEFGSANPYHSSSESQSSSDSGYSMSQPSQPSSVSSPARSMSSSRTPSSTSKYDVLMNNSQSSMESFKPNIILAPSQPRSPVASKASFSERRARPDDLRMDPAIQGGSTPRQRSPLASPAMYLDRMDPAVQVGRGRSPPPQTHSRQQSNGRSRGNCKACQLPITGKSISSADGRLTGRYHKACFVCTTCEAPFTSSTFYVFDDKPYDAECYHRVNGSCCTTCGVGIEGLYLEDDSTNKHHPGCFRCSDCDKVLRDGYFEVSGKAYCERDAWRRSQQPMTARMPQGRNGFRPPGGRVGLPSGNRLGPRPRMEKRMTRLGMM